MSTELVRGTGFVAHPVPNVDRPSFVIEGVEKKARAFLLAKDAADIAVEELGGAKLAILEEAATIRKHLRVRDPATLRFTTGKDRSVDVVQSRQFTKLPEKLKEQVMRLPERIRRQLVEEFIEVVLKPREDILDVVKTLRADIEEVNPDLVAALRGHMDPGECVKASAAKTAPKS